jgi:hypothetical protein
MFEYIDVEGGLEALRERKQLTMQKEDISCSFLLYQPV